MRGDGYTPGQLDAWITGNYGNDHPDNRPRYCAQCERELTEDDLGNFCKRCDDGEEDSTDEKNTG